MKEFVFVQGIYILRMIIAGLLGIFIGIERRNRAKEAGVRTHCVVACATALMMIISKYGFSDMLIDALGTKGADPARMAAQVISGIGFLGAGMIYVHHSNIKGLTTAAGIWATSGVGMAIGAGMYVVGIAGALIIVTAQIILHKTFNAQKPVTPRVIKIKNVDKRDYSLFVKDELRKLGVNVTEISVHRYIENNLCDYSFYIEMPCDMNEENILDFIEYEVSISSEK